MLLSKAEMKNYVVKSLKSYIDDLKPLIKRSVTIENFYTILDQYGVNIPVHHDLSDDDLKRLIFEEHDLCIAPIVVEIPTMTNTFHYRYFVANAMLASLFTKYAYEYIKLHVRNSEMSIEEVNELYFN